MSAQQTFPCPDRLDQHFKLLADALLEKKETTARSRIETCLRTLQHFATSKILVYDAIVETFRSLISHFDEVIECIRERKLGIYAWQPLYKAQACWEAIKNHLVFVLKIA